ncbi:hypothetical protein [Ruminococcus flavefaciens]|uniref:hypothetical protein n=1 Tax=Ruminococcus flavefaciens TaxID=1265 RepID=UPI0013DA7477|nr:hypothetical protein [Ruminococcus flavefaciens]
MNFTNMLTNLAQISDAENPTIFPFPFPMHIAIVIISVIFFGFRFAVQKKPYQLIFAIAVPISLLLWVSNNKTLYYTVGIIELILILLAVISTFVFKPKKAEAVTAAAEEKAEEAGSDKADEEKAEEADSDKADEEE